MDDLSVYNVTVHPKLVERAKYFAELYEQTYVRTQMHPSVIQEAECMSACTDLLEAIKEFEQRPDAIKPGDDDMHWGGGQPVELRPGLTPIPDNVASILARGMMDEETAKGMARRHIRELEHKLNLLKGVFGDPTEVDNGPDAA